MISKLLLQYLVRLFRLSHHNQPRSVHVEPMNHHQFFRFGIFIVQPSFNRQVVSKSVNAQHSRWFVYNYQCIIVVNDSCRSVIVFFFALFLPVVKTEHPRQQRVAFAATRFVETAMTTQLATRRLAIPELSQCQRLHAISESILQQFWSATLSRACWRQLAVIVAEYFEKVSLLTLVVQHYEVREKPALQLVRQCSSHLFQARNIRQPLLYFFPIAVSLFLQSLFQSLCFSLLKLAFAYKPLLQLGIFRVLSAQSVAPLLCLSHSLARFFNFLCGRCFKSLQRFFQFAELFRLLKRFNLSVYRVNLRLVLLEISVRLQIVENGRHKPSPVASSANLS